jgi:hypothetical protein
VFEVPPRHLHALPVHIQGGDGPLLPGPLAQALEPEQGGAAGVEDVRAPDIS